MINECREGALAVVHASKLARRDSIDEYRAANSSPRARARGAVETLNVDAAAARIAGPRGDICAYRL